MRLAPAPSCQQIITYVQEGAVTHEDSLGNKGRTHAGERTTPWTSASTASRLSCPIPPPVKLRDKTHPCWSGRYRPALTGQGV
ncbi:pirin family protein [Bradyrhizobium sp. cir1]|uniref:pirin family protein n=1 Tax=Bradyrhizobium sp. cir1 TaxID=1445730 RepID=UPI0039080B3E